MDVFDLQASLKLNTSDFKKSLNTAKSEIESFVNEANKTFENLITDFPPLSLEIKKEVEEAEKNISTISDAVGKEADETKKESFKLGEALKDGFSATASAIKSGLEIAAKAGTAAITAASAAVATFTKSVVADYANYEQLVGGIETLFGESSSKLLANADAAYKTAGMSVNEYMETSIQGAAALINSLDGDQQKAADLMDMSIIDMSDNVNKMGTTMESVQNAYRGFSRGNFTMLDNLALGFAGTKEGMQELLDKAQEISGIEYDIESYSDIVQAIHAVQQEMGITGTTASEAAETISGSAGSVSAAWANLKIEIGKENGDIGKSFDILANSISTSANNIIPRVKRILSGIGDAITTLSPMISQAIPAVVADILPDVLTSATTLVNALTVGIVDLLPAVGTAINTSLPLVWQQLKDVGNTLYNSVVVPAWNFITTKLPKMLNDGFSRINLVEVGTRIGNLIKTGLDGISNFVKELDWGLIARQLTDCIMHIDWVGILKSLSGVLVSIVKQVPDIIGNLYHGIVDGITDLLSGDVGSISTEINDAFAGARESTKNMRDEIDNARGSFEELKTAADDVAEAQLIEIGRTESLWKELQTLVDENGKLINEGYAERVNYINGELSRATGTEIELIDGQIAKYGELKDTINDVIKQKRISVMGEAYEDVYSRALQESHNAGARAHEVQSQINADNAQLQNYYNSLRAKIVELGNTGLSREGFSQDDIEKLKSMNFDNFIRSIGTKNAIDESIGMLLGNDVGEAVKGVAKDRTSSINNYDEIVSDQQRYNSIVEMYEKAETAAANGHLSLAQTYFNNISDIENGTYQEMEENTGNTLSFIKTQIDDAVALYEDSVKVGAKDADTELRGTIESLIAYGKESGIEGAELTKAGIVAVLDTIDSFDSSGLESFMADLGIKLGDLMSTNVFTSLSGELQSLITQMLYDANNLIKPVINDDGSIRFGGINSPGDVQAYLHADGGIFRKETHIFGEAGAEAVIPLANDELGIRQIADALSRNMGAGTVINVNLDGANISSDYDVDRISDRFIEAISEKLESLKISDSRGYGGVYA